MAEPVHIAITRRVRKECVGDYERALGEFARRSLLEHGARGVHLLYPPPGSSSMEYGVLRTFASVEDRHAFYASHLYKEWVVQIAPGSKAILNVANCAVLKPGFVNRFCRCHPIGKWRC